MKNKKRVTSAQLDTQIASVEAALETNLKLKNLRIKVEGLLEQVFPCDEPDDGHDWVNDAMEFFELGVEDVFLDAISYRGSERDEVHPDERKEFFKDLGCPCQIAGDRQQQEKPYVLDELISEAPDEMSKLATDEELRAFFSEMREMFKEDTDE